MYTIPAVLALTIPLARKQATFVALYISSFEIKFGISKEVKYLDSTTTPIKSCKMRRQYF